MSLPPVVFPTVAMRFMILGYGEPSDKYHAIPSIPCLTSSTSAYIFKPHSLPMVDCLEPCWNALLYETRLFSIGLPYRNVI
jgi:hypothetical protein